MARITLTIEDKLWKTIGEISKETKTTKKDVITRYVRIGLYIDDLAKNGQKLSTEDKDAIKSYIIFPALT